MWLESNYSSPTHKGWSIFLFRIIHSAAMVHPTGLEPMTPAFFSHSMKAFSNIKSFAKLIFLTCPFLVDFNLNLKDREPILSIGIR